MLDIGASRRFTHRAYSALGMPSGERHFRIGGKTARNRSKATSPSHGKRSTAPPGAAGERPTGPRS